MSNVELIAEGIRQRIRQVAAYPHTAEDMRPLNILLDDILELSGMLGKRVNADRCCW